MTGIAVIGSANMDYRSLYLHFENGAVFYGGHTVQDVKTDMVQSFERATEVSLEDTRHLPWYKRILRSIVRFLAPRL